MSGYDGHSTFYSLLFSLVMVLDLDIHKNKCMKLWGIMFLIHFSIMIQCLTLSVVTVFPFKWNVCQLSSKTVSFSVMTKI